MNSFKLSAKLVMIFFIPLPSIPTTALRSPVPAHPEKNAPNPAPISPIPIAPPAAAGPNKPPATSNADKPANCVSEKDDNPSLVYAGML